MGTVPGRYSLLRSEVSDVVTSGCNDREGVGYLHLLAAPDKFRGTASAATAALAIARAARGSGWTCMQLPLADGGEGTLEVLGGPTHSTKVSGPLGIPVEAAWRLSGSLAVIEMARASGLMIVGGRERNDPMHASSKGTGELILAAIKKGARRIIVGVGGSASTDGGAEAVDLLEPYGPFDGSRGLTVLVACDVQTTFLEAGAIFGPQKGANSEQVAALSLRLSKLARHYKERYGTDVRHIVGGGAAGGLAGGLAALGARLVPGFDLVAQEVGLVDALRHADLVVTGEGRIDAQSFAGKVVGGVTSLAARLGTDVLVVAGDAEFDNVQNLSVTTLVGTFGTERAWSDTAACIEECVRMLLVA